VKRLDLQVSVGLRVPDRDLARRLYHDYRRRHHDTANTKPATYMSSITGDTLGIGNRSKEVFLRLYDKSGESKLGELGSIWRYEVEYKRGVAGRVYKELMSAKDKYTYIAGKVYAEYEKRSVEPLFSPDSVEVAMESKYEVTTAETKLAWLERCVAPVVTQLVNLGYEDEVVRNLKRRGVYREAGNDGGERSI